MVKPKVELKHFVEDANFIDKMDRAFSDLRADYELSMDTSQQKINELKETHVDINNFLSDLISYSKNSSGVISGLRGTGKTHLFLLARNDINRSFFENKSNRCLCIYLNVKRLTIPDIVDQELFSRIFSIFVYDELAKQLNIILNQLVSDNFVETLLDLFNNDKKQMKRSLLRALYMLSEFKNLSYSGNEKFENLERGSVSREEFNRELLDIQSKIGIKINLTGEDIGSELSLQQLEEITNRLSTDNTYLQYLNVGTVREQIIDMMKALKITSITFFVDEWEKLYYKPSIQQFLSFFIDRIIDDPIYFWIGMVPHRGSLYHLDHGADLQHFFNLDACLVFENSKTEKIMCMHFFKEFINKRLYYYFKDGKINYKLLFNDDRRFESLVIASMGNTRDFGTMLIKCWSEFISYRKNNLRPGHPYQYINLNMVTSAIKNDGEKKISNIRNDAATLSVWHDLERFCTSKKSSHFAIAEAKENIDCMNCREYSELIYHRLLHFRKGHVPAKDTTIESKLSIYALSYTISYDLHSKDRKIVYVTEYDEVHDRVRRYIYDPKTIINNIRIQNGDIFPCVSCGTNININTMSGAWNNNSCPYCGKRIRNNVG